MTGTSTSPVPCKNAPSSSSAEERIPRYGAFARYRQRPALPRPRRRLRCAGRRRQARHRLRRPLGTAHRSGTSDPEGPRGRSSRPRATAASSSALSTPPRPTWAELIVEAVPSDREGAAGRVPAPKPRSAPFAWPAASRVMTLIVKFAGNYHGHGRSRCRRGKLGCATLGVPNSPGVTAAPRDTLVLALQRLRGVERVFAETTAHVAGVILEPVVGNMGCVIPTPRVS